MSLKKFFFLCLALALATCSVSAVGDYEFTDEDISLGDPILVGDSVVDGPIPVTVIPTDDVYADMYAAAAPSLVIGDDPPSDSPFYGAGFITGTDSRLGTVTLYFPIDYRSGRWGVDSNGYLFNVSSSSMSGYLSGVYNNSVSAQGFSYPRYRLGSGSSYEYIDLHLVPSDSNMEIAVSNAPKYSPADFLPYLTVFFLGVLVCFMKRS